MTVSFITAQTVMEAMGLIAIIVNCYLIGQCGQLQRLFPWLSPEMAIISIVILEVTTYVFFLLTFYNLRICIPHSHSIALYIYYVLVS